MATAAVKVIDIGRSYIPIDPNSFPESMHSTGAEDIPESRVPAVPYAGYNFMPTGYGYMSYFGINSLFGKPLVRPTTPFDALRCDDIFIVQTNSLSNIIVALCEDGIWTKTGSDEDDWEQVIVLTVPDTGEHKNWTKCVIGNEVFMYRAGEAHYWVMRDDESFVPTQQTPTHLNMAAQQGIYKAGGRLGFWDSANSTAWGDVDTKSDFVPSLETGAGNAIFQGIVGKIVNVLQHGNGFVIYATRSIVYVQRTNDANQFWRAETVFNENGISYLNEVTHGQPDTTHFAYTTFGLVKIENGQPDFIIPEVFSYLKESRDPVYLRILEGRYLFLQVINPDYITGIPNFTVEEVPASSITFKGASYAVTHVSQNPCKALKGAQNQQSLFLHDSFGYTSYNQANAEGSVPIYQDNIATVIPVATLVAYHQAKADGINLFDPTNDALFDKTGLRIYDSSGAETFFYLEPALGALPRIDDYEELIHQEANQNTFFAKQEMAWQLQEEYFIDYIAAMTARVNRYITEESLNTFPGTSSSVARVFYDSAALAPGTQVVVTDWVPINTEGFTPPDIDSIAPFIDLRAFNSVVNKYYGIAEKSAWVQRSLAAGYDLVLERKLEVSINSYEGLARFNLSYNPHGIAVDSIIADFDSLLLFYAPGGGLDAAIQAHFGGTGVSSVNIANRSAVMSEATLPMIWTITREVTIIYEEGPPGTPFVVEVRYTAMSAVHAVPIINLNNPLFSDLIPSWDYLPPAPGIGDWHCYVYNVKQNLRIKEIKYPTFEPCVYTELGFTEIIGHGHYELDGSFVVDDSTPEAPDYIDQCLTPPVKTRKPFFNGTAIPAGLAQGCLAGPVEIDEELITYPDYTIVLPPSSFLMQDGSIEPIYPTFQGAFVYDLQLKKWGKCGQPYKVLMNYSPVNSQAGDRPVPSDIFSVNAGCLLESGDIAIFDKFPIDSKLYIGKIGYFRKGFTDCHGVDIQHRNLATGSVTIEGSLDGKNINPAISQIYSYENTNVVSALFSSSARWFNVVIDGIYDIKHIDFNGSKKGKR